LRADIREGRLQLAAERVYDHDDRNGDPGGDQSVLDRGSPGFSLIKRLARLAMLMSLKSNSN
jgi:hypothetical protein